MKNPRVSGGDFSFSLSQAYCLNSNNIRFVFAYNTVSVSKGPEPRLCDFAVQCKRCGETIPAPVRMLPDIWIIAVCPLWGERRAYLPPDIFRGRLSFRLTRKPVRSERRI